MFAPAAGYTPSGVQRVMLSTKYTGGALGRFRVHTHAPAARFYTAQITKETFLSNSNSGETQVQDISCMWHSQVSCDNSVYFVESFSLSQFGGIRTHIQKEKSAISSKNNIKDLKRSFLVLKT